MHHGSVWPPIVPSRALCMQAIGHPIVGDEAYGGEPLFLSQLKRKYRPSADGERPMIGRSALHAHTLRLAHPVTNAELLLEAPLPKDMEVGLKYLRKFVGGV